MSEKLRTAVIGVGHLGKEHARIYHSLESAELVAVCDTNETQGRAIAERFGVRYVPDFRDLLGEVFGYRPGIFRISSVKGFWKAGNVRGRSGRRLKTSPGGTGRLIFNPPEKFHAGMYSPQ